MSDIDFARSVEESFVGLAPEKVSQVPFICRSLKFTILPWLFGVERILQGPQAECCAFSLHTVVMSCAQAQNSSASRYFVALPPRTDHGHCLSQHESHPQARCPPRLLVRFKMTWKFQTKSKEKTDKCTAMEAFGPCLSTQNSIPVQLSPKKKKKTLAKKRKLRSGQKEKWKRLRTCSVRKSWERQMPSHTLLGLSLSLSSKGKLNMLVCSKKKR